MVQLEPDRRNRALLLLLYGTGLRVSEACGLRWGDIQENSDSALLTVSGKGGRSRTISLPRTILDEFISFGCGPEPDQPIFPSRSGKPLDRSRVLRIVKGATARAGVNPKATTHWPQGVWAIETAMDELAIDQQRIDGINDDLRKYKDLRKVRKMGSSNQPEVVNGLCPTCHQEVVDSLLDTGNKATPMTVDQNVSFYEEQIKLFTAVHGNAIYSIETAEKVKISPDTYQPEVAGVNLTADVSGSDLIRLHWAYLLALLEAGLQKTGNHPGLLIFDEPQQQSVEETAFREMLRHASGEKNSQIIITIYSTTPTKLRENPENMDGGGDHPNVTVGGPAGSRHVRSDVNKALKKFAPKRSLHLLSS